MRQHRPVPSSQSTTRRLRGVLVATLLAALPATPASAETVVAANGLRVVAPAPGQGVAVTALMSDGRGLGLVVETDSDGVTRMVEPGVVAIAARGRPGAAASPDACADGKHAETGFRWDRPWAWRFRASSTPAGLGRAKAEADLRAAVRSITTARNDCGRPDRVRARATYLGRTGRKPGVRVDASSIVRCSNDGRSVVGFGPLPPGIAGLTCTTYAKVAGLWKPAVESDVLLNKRHHRWAARMRTCSKADNELILRSVATHEFGHVFGLDHVREDGHGNLTMSEAIGACDDSAFTLGKGDIIGLERLY